MCEHFRAGQVAKQTENFCASPILTELGLLKLGTDVSLSVGSLANDGSYRMIVSLHSSFLDSVWDKLSATTPLINKKSIGICGSSGSGFSSAALKKNSLLALISSRRHLCCTERNGHSFKEWRLKHCFGHTSCNSGLLKFC